MSKTVRKYVTIEMEGKPFKVRTFIIGDASPDKRTLVFTHGMVSASVLFFSYFARFVDDYQIVLFDNCSKGGNTKLNETAAIESPEAAEKWVSEFMIKTIDALELPDKFLISGHSYGGWLAALYASLRPERIESMFLVSPCYMQPYDPETYDPTKFTDMMNTRRT